MASLTRRLCLSAGTETVRALRDAVRALPPAVDLVEVRLDRLAPEAVRSQEWLRLPREDASREWVLTWRSRREGGHDGRPSGAYARGLEAGFRWIDVEAGALESGDAEAAAVPPERRWVSHHAGRAPPSPDAVQAAWDRVAAHSGAVHKCVVTADRFVVNEWILETGRRARARGPAILFAQGWTGHVSRLLGHAEGNAVTFVAADTPTAPGQPTWREAVGRYDLPRLRGNAALYGVLGNPVRASRSPDIHNHAFRSRGQAALYVPLESPEAEPVLAWVRSGRIRGASVTAPFKERVAALVDRLEPEGKRLGAVNTVWMEGEVLTGANTDIEAARALIAELLPGDGPVAVLGAGGGAAAVAAAARDGGHAVTLFNRSAPAGRRLGERLGCGWGGAPESLEPAAFALVVNAVPAGVPVPAGVAGRAWSHASVLDLAYGNGPTAWETLAGRAGIPYRGGLEFLVRQACGQIARWTGTAGDPEALREALR